MKLTDEQYERIGFEAHRFAHLAGTARLIASGRAAVAAVAPLVLAEPSDSEMIATATDAQTNWKFGSDGDYGRVRRIFANRLASVTAKPDPAVHEVWQELRSQEGYPPSNGDESTRLRLKAEKLVAVVDAARAPKR